MSDRVKTIVELKEQMKQLATSLQTYSLDWKLVGKAQHEGYMSSVTDSFIQRKFGDNGHMKGWLSVHVTEIGHYNAQGQMSYKYYVRVGSSKRKFQHERNWSFQTTDLPEKIQALGDAMSKVMEVEIAQDREERRKDMEAKKKVKEAFSDLPGWGMANDYSLSSAIEGPGYKFEIYSTMDANDLRHQLDLGELSPEEIRLVVRTLLDHKKSKKVATNAR